MKRVLKFMLMATLLMVLSAGVAVALPYSSTITVPQTAVGSSVNSAANTIHFSFAPISSGQYFTEAALSLTLSGVLANTTISWLLDYRPDYGWKLTNPLPVPVGTTSLNAILTGEGAVVYRNNSSIPYIAYPGADGLVTLNKYLVGPLGQIGTGVTLGSGGATVLSASLTGNVAPEPATMALMGAGIAGLPFVRRFRKKGSDQE